MFTQEAQRVFEQHARAVHAAVYRVTLNAHAAEDATQEAFVRLMTHPPAEQSNIPAWLKRVAVNYAIDVLRKHGRLRMLPEEHDVEAPEQAEPTGDQAMSDDLVHALKRLKPDQRAAVLAVDRDGMSYQDAADLLGVHVNKLRTDLCRGRRALHDMLKAGREMDARRT